MNEIVNLGNGQFVKVMMLKGQQGDNIQSIAKTSTNVLVDTYTITLTDGSTKTFTVTNGKGIVSTNSSKRSLNNRAYNFHSYFSTPCDYCNENSIPLFPSFVNVFDEKT